MATTQTAADWCKQWFAIEDATYLNTAAHAASPCVALRAVQTSIEANKFPHHVEDAVFFEAPAQIRTSPREPFPSSCEHQLSSHCADDREVMVIVVCDKLHEVDKPQFPLEARMQRRTRYDRIVSIR